MKTTRRTVYFPACGFGFWYLLGVYMRMVRDIPPQSHIHQHYIIRGSSAGSMMCLVSCLKDQYLSFDWIANTAEKIRNKYTKTGRIPNLRIIVKEFIGHLVRAADPEKLKYCFDNRCLEIQISRVTCCGLVPEIVSPIFIEEFMELMEISCTIPLMSRNLNPFGNFQICCARRRHNNSASWCCSASYVDGGFVEYCASPEPADMIVSIKYRTIIIPSREWCERTWKEGLEWNGGVVRSTEPPTVIQMNRI